jgi:integrase
MTPSGAILSATRPPVRSEGKVRSSLGLAELEDLRAKLTADPRAVYLDLPDLVDFMTATGLRIGEALAVRWQAADLDAGTVEVQATIVRIKGKSVVLMEKPKSKALAHSRTSVVVRRPAPSSTSCRRTQHVGRRLHVRDRPAS